MAKKSKVSKSGTAGAKTRKATPRYLNAGAFYEMGLQDVVKALTVIREGSHQAEFDKAAPELTVRVEARTGNFIKDFMAQNSLHKAPFGRKIVNAMKAPGGDPFRPVNFGPGDPVRPVNFGPGDPVRPVNVGAGGDPFAPVKFGAGDPVRPVNVGGGGDPFGPVNFGGRSMSAVRAAQAGQGGPVSIACVNKATVDLGVPLAKLTPALQHCFDQYFLPVWGYPVKLYDTQTPRPTDWQLIYFDDADTAGALGYHELTHDGQPISKVFVKTTLAVDQLVSVTACHELFEMAIDPLANLWAEASDGSEYAYEMCDAVEEDTFEVDGIKMSNFVHPSWFEPFNHPSGTQFDHLGRLTKPFSMTEGGYVIVKKDGKVTQEFGSREKAARFAEENRWDHRSEYRKPHGLLTRPKVTPTYLSAVSAYDISLSDMIGALDTIEKSGRLGDFLDAAKRGKASVLVGAKTVNFVKDFLVRNGLQDHPVGKHIVNAMVAGDDPFQGCDFGNH
jgi:hypothetical protein